MVTRLEFQQEYMLSKEPITKLLSTPCVRICLSASAFLSPCLPPYLALYLGSYHLKGQSEPVWEWLLPQIGGMKNLKSIKAGSWGLGRQGQQYTVTTSRQLSSRSCHTCGPGISVSPGRPALQGLTTSSKHSCGNNHSIYHAWNHFPGALCYRFREAYSQREHFGLNTEGKLYSWVRAFTSRRLWIQLQTLITALWETTDRNGLLKEQIHILNVIKPECFLLS